jgi:hypothetical protein
VAARDVRPSRECESTAQRARVYVMAPIMRHLRILILFVAACSPSDGGDAPTDATVAVDAALDGVVATIDGAQPDAAALGKRVFVTSQMYNADLQSINGAATGADSADGICNNAAAAVGLSGTWRAWISDSTVNAIDRISGTGPWYRLDGVMVFLNHANLSTQPLARINVTETGDAISFPPTLTTVWTGTASGGRYTSTTIACSGWSDLLGKGTVGDASYSDTQWTIMDRLDCDLLGRLYCFEM